MRTTGKGQGPGTANSRLCLVSAPPKRGTCRRGWGSGHTLAIRVQHRHARPVGTTRGEALQPHVKPRAAWTMARQCPLLSIIETVPSLVKARARAIQFSREALTPPTLSLVRQARGVAARLVSPLPRSGEGSGVRVALAMPSSTPLENIPLGRSSPASRARIAAACTGGSATSPLTKPTTPPWTIARQRPQPVPRQRPQHIHRRQADAHALRHQRPGQRRRQVVPGDPSQRDGQGERRPSNCSFIVTIQR